MTMMQSITQKVLLQFFNHITNKHPKFSNLCLFRINKFIPENSPPKVYCVYPLHQGSATPDSSKSSDV